MLKSAFIPNFRLVSEFIRRRQFERIQMREEEGRIRQWFLLCGRADQQSLLNPQPSRLQKLLPPADRAWADPFLWKQGNDFYIFCEEWIYGTPHAHIAVMQVSADGLPLSPTRPVLQLDYHLSYPFLVEHDGVLYMLPEAGQGRSMDVYQCEDFPGRWGKHATLMQNVQYVDATLFERECRWWMFVAFKRGLLSFNRDLFVFSAETPFSTKWKAHPANPVVRELASARPAGRTFNLDGKLYRPSQNCLVRYGYSLNVNEVIVLDPQSYQERLVTEVKPDWGQGIRANHHIDWHAGLLVMDAQRLLPAKT
jgi:hypothetical protein